MRITLNNLYDKMLPLQGVNTSSEVLFHIVEKALDYKSGQLSGDYHCGGKSFAKDVDSDSDDEIDISNQAGYLKTVIAKRCEDGEQQKKIEEINNDIMLVKEFISQAKKNFFYINLMSEPAKIIKAAKDFLSLGSC